MELVSVPAFWADKLIASAFLMGLIYMGFRLRKDFRWWFFIGSFFIFLFLFGIIRIVLLFIFYNGLFADLTALQILYAFIDGIRFDACATATLSGVCSLCFLIPLVSKTYYKVVTWLIAGAWSLALWASVGDIIYFSFVKRHTGSELWLAIYDVDLLVSLVCSRYIWLIAILIVLSVLIVWGMSKLLNTYYHRPQYARWKYGVCILLGSVCLFFAFRGHFGFRFRPLTVVDAYEDGNIIRGNLALNGVFCMYKSLSKRYAPLPDAVAVDEALERSRQILASSQEKFISQEFPLLRQREQFNVKGKQYNLVVLLLESWQYRYTDSLAGTHYGATPFLDELINQSLVFDNFYASGQRSIHGAGSVMTGVAQLAGLPYFSLGLEEYHFTGLAQLLKQKGYETIFAQPSEWNSAKVGTVAQLAGFDEIYGRESITSRLDYMRPGTILDYDALQFLAEKLRGRKRPFLAFFFSLATHPPFGKVHDNFNRFAWDAEDRGYLNALNYMDWSIGQFIKQLKEQGQYDNTIFVVLADHTLGCGESSGDFYTRFHIPLFIHAPGLLSAQHMQTLGSQVDVLPTIVDLLNIDIPYAAMGTSLLDRSVSRFGFSSQDGRILEWLRPEGQLEYVGNKRIDVGEAEVLPEGEERNLLALNRSVYELLRTDRWAPQE